MDGLMLDEEQFFELKANIVAPGYQSLALQGYLTKQKGGDTYIAPLLPRMFYGADGTQLGASWRQNFTAAGEQVVLSRSGGQPKVGEPDIYWKKVATGHEEEAEAKPTVKPTSITDQIMSWWNGLTAYEKLLWILAGGTVAGTLGYAIYTRKKMSELRR